MNWRYETWRKLYCREEGSFAALSYSARALAAMLLKHCDDKGRIYARAGEDLTDSICFRMGADRGERRMVKKALAELVSDGYLVQNDGWLRIKNFHHAQGKVEVIDLTGGDRVATETRTSSDRASNEPRPRRDDDATEARPSSDDDATATPSCTEDCVKSADSEAPSPPLPSVPSEPAIPEVPSLAEQAARARDPGAPAWDTDQVPDPAPTRAQRSPLTGGTLLATFGRLREQIVPNTLAWHVAGGGMYAKAEDMARSFDTDPAAVLDIEPTMRLVLEAAKVSQDPREGDPAFLFGRWISSFTARREQVLGLRRAPSSPGKDCAFHRAGRNQGKRASKVEFRHDCPECKHLSARAGPRPAAAPEGIAELIEGYTEQNGR